MRTSRLRVLGFLLLVGLAGSSRSYGNTIGTFSSARVGVHLQFHLFSGQLNRMDEARAALIADGHSLVKLDAGINGSSLMGIDTVYLPLAFAPPIPQMFLSESEVTALFEFVVRGGTLIVQGDVTGVFSQTYNNLALEFGLQYVSDTSFGFAIVTLSGTLSGLTDGPFGTATSLATLFTGTITVSETSAGVSLLDSLSIPHSSLYAFGPENGSPGTGHAIFLADVNHFDDDEAFQNGGFSKGDGEIFWRNMFALGGTLSVELDIQPGNDLNSISCNGPGNNVIAIAVLTTEAFDAMTIDDQTVRFGPGEAQEIHGRGHLGDVDGDGDPDIVYHFRFNETGLTCADTEATISGTTTGERAFEGTDSIRMVAGRLGTKRT